MTSFDHSPSWVRYRTLLADAFDLHLLMTPKEGWREVRGHRLRVDEWAPEGDAKGTLILVHGGGGNGRILAPFAEPAAVQGWHVLAPDLPGYGLTRPAPDFSWDYAEWPAVIADLAQSASGSVVLMGASMGGLTAVYAAQDAPNVRGVMATTLIDLSDPALFVRAARWPWLGLLSRFGMVSMPWLMDGVAMPLVLAAPMKAMSGVPAVQRYFSEDRYLGRHRIPTRFWRTVHEFHRVDIWLECPLLVIHPGADTWTPPEMSRPCYDRIAAEKEWIDLSNGSHLPLEQPAYDELRGHVRGFLDRIAGDQSSR